jgi:hypothetical protein
VAPIYAEYSRQAFGWEAEEQLFSDDFDWVVSFVIPYMYGYNCPIATNFIIGSTAHEPAQVKPRDALHVAYAQHGGCDFFITCDDALIQRALRSGRQPVLQVKVVNPVEFIRNEGGRYGKG